MGGTIPVYSCGGGTCIHDLRTRRTGFGGFRRSRRRRYGTFCLFLDVCLLRWPLCMAHNNRKATLFPTQSLPFTHQSFVVHMPPFLFCSGHRIFHDSDSTFSPTDLQSLRPRGGDSAFSGVPPPYYVALPLRSVLPSLPHSVHPPFLPPPSQGTETYRRRSG